MSVAADTSNHTNGGASSATTTGSWSIDIGSAAGNRAIVVMLKTYGSSSAETCTVGGVSASLVSAATSSNNDRTVMFALANPGTGTLTISCSWTSSAQWAVGFLTATGVDQTTPAQNGNHTEVFNATTTLVITTAAGNLTVDFAASRNLTLSSTTQTQAFTDSNTQSLCVCTYKASTGTSNSHGVTYSGASDTSHSGIDFLAAASGPTVALEWNQPISQPTDHYRTEITNY